MLDQFSFVSPGFSPPGFGLRANASEREVAFLSSELKGYQAGSHWAGGEGDE